MASGVYLTVSLRIKSHKIKNDINILDHNTTEILIESNIWNKYFQKSNNEND